MTNRSHWTRRCGRQLVMSLISEIPRSRPSGAPTASQCPTLLRGQCLSLGGAITALSGSITADANGVTGAYDASSGRVAITGSAAGEIIQGTGWKDTIFGGAGSDTIVAGAGDERHPPLGRELWRGGRPARVGGVDACTQAKRARRGCSS